MSLSSSSSFFFFLMKKVSEGLKGGVTLTVDG